MEALAAAELPVMHPTRDGSVETRLGRIEDRLAEVLAAMRRLEANGVTGYSWERCWYDYQINLWRPLISVCAVAP